MQVSRLFRRFVPTLRSELIWLSVVFSLTTGADRTLCAADDNTGIRLGPAAYTVDDTLAATGDEAPGTRIFLRQYEYSPETFAVQCDTNDHSDVVADYDFLIDFPSPKPSGDQSCDRVKLEWYAVRSADGRVKKAPAMLVVHDMSAPMLSGRLFARGLKSQGIHAFMIQLPFYGRRPTTVRVQYDEFWRRVFRQGVCDVRRARDVIAAIEQVDHCHIGLQGTSLGGFVSVLAASLDGKFTTVHIVLAGAGMYDIITKGKRDSAIIRERLDRAGYSGQKLRVLLREIDPARTAHRLNPEKTWLYSASNDTVVPPENAKLLARGISLPEDHHRWIAADHYTSVIFFPQIVGQITAAAQESVEQCKAGAAE